MRKVYLILMVTMWLCLGCQWQLRPASQEEASTRVSIQRYDRIESLYLTTGDYAALQQMNTYFPMETRMLIEDVLHLGRVDDPAINTKFLYFFQDSTLQRMLTDVQQQFADIDDLNESLSAAFERLRQELPELETPSVYAQIGSFDQSIVVGNNTLGICLDKYLGADYPFYAEHYESGQRRMMTRDMIVPDCLGFYILSFFPLPSKNNQAERDLHMGKIQWMVNRLMASDIFENDCVSVVETYMKKNSSATMKDLMAINSRSLKKND